GRGRARAPAGALPPHRLARHAPEEARARAARRARLGDRAARRPAPGGRLTAALLALNRRTFASLRYRNYRLFFSGQVISVTGTWMQRVAQAWLVLQLTHSAVAVGILALAQLLPYSTFGLVAGVLVDRFDPRRLVIATQATVMALAALLAGLAFTGSAEAWHVYVI